MITIPTVLILGAGASKPYNLPTARDLVLQICQILQPDSWEFRVVQGASRKSHALVQGFPDALCRARPLSVDAWLEKGENEEVREIGKASIAMSVLNSEKEHLLLRPKEPEQDWYQALWEKLDEDAQFETWQRNQLRVVTFNYDRSLEQDLFIRLQYNYPGKSEPEYAAKLEASVPIVHVYGSLGRVTWQAQEAGEAVPYDFQRYLGLLTSRRGPEYRAFDRDQEAHRAIVHAMRSIELIPAEGEKPAKTDAFDKARQLIESAQALYYIGFGYHPNNIERLGIESLKKPRKVMGTTLELDLTERNYLARLYPQPFGKWAPRDGFKSAFPPVNSAVFLRKHVDFDEVP